jgi:hypothetical protein
VVKEEIDMLNITQKAKAAILANGGDVDEAKNLVRIPANATPINNVSNGGWGNFSCQEWEFTDGSRVVYTSDEGYTLGRKAQVVE